MNATALDQYAAQVPPTLTLGDEALDAIADLALRLSHADAARTQRVLLAHELRPYAARSQRERQNARVTVTRIVQALMMLGHLDQP